MLFLLIRNLCKYKCPSTGWKEDPDETDITEIADCIRLKNGRNRTQHEVLSMTTTQYKALYKYLCGPLLRLGSSQEVIDNLLPSLRFDIPQASESFVGRETELDSIHQNITKKTVVITGIPGVGKSELSKKYCEMNNHVYDHYIWINGQSIENGYKELSTILDLKEKENLRLIKHLLSDYFRNEKVLFIYDNCTDMVLLAQALLVDHANIVTTQIKVWDTKSYHTIPLETWSEAEAQTYLNKTMNGDEKDFYKPLIDLFNCHPLGIQHAVTFVQQSVISIEDYLSMVAEENNQLDLICEEVALDNIVQRSVISSFIVTIAKLEQDHPSAYQLLSVMSVLDGSSMDEELLKLCYSQNKLDYINAKRVLLSFNMVKYNEYVQEFTFKKTNYLTMHSLY